MLIHFLLTQSEADKKRGLDEGHPHGDVVAEVADGGERAHHQQREATFQRSPKLSNIQHRYEQASGLVFVSNSPTPREFRWSLIITSDPWFSLFTI